MYLKIYANVDHFVQIQDLYLIFDEAKNTTNVGI